MNKFFNILFFSFIIISCGFEDNPILNDVGITSISVSMSSDKVDANESITFEAKDNNQNTVTSSCKFYVDGQLISGSTYSTATGGDHEVFATSSYKLSNKCFSRGFYSNLVWILSKCIIWIRRIRK